ncbi:MAG: STAS domain-containing protein [Oscillospiraceae bacterium]|nr:STAS domain-containing protein [Oscillospiraceae bacterium]
MAELNYKREGEVLTVCPKGRLDTNTSPVFQASVEPLMEGVGLLRLDLAELSYLSSAGLRVLLSLLQDMEDRNGKMELCNVNESVRDVFDITGLLDVLTIV